MKKIVILLLLLLLLGCEEEQDMNLQVIPETNVEEETPLTQEELLVIENDRINAEIIKNIHLIEFSLNKLYELEMTYDDYVTHVQALIGNDTLNQHLNNLLFAGHLSLISGNQSDISVDDKIKLTSGMTLNEVQTLYRPLIDAYYDENFTGYTYEDVKISRVYDDGYFRTVYTERTFWVEGGRYIESMLDGEPNEFFVYRKYTLMKSGSEYIISDIDHTIYFDWSKLPQVGDGTSQQEYHEKTIKKYLYFEDEKVIFMPFVD